MLAELKNLRRAERQQGATTTRRVSSDKAAGLDWVSMLSATAASCVVDAKGSIAPRSLYAPPRSIGRRKQETTSLTRLQNETRYVKAKSKVEYLPAEVSELLVDALKSHV